MASRSTFLCGIGAAFFLLFGWVHTAQAGNEEPVVTLGRAIYHVCVSSVGKTYELVGRTLPTDPDWLPVAGPKPGTGDLLYFFEEGEGPDWLPARAWSVSMPTDGSSLDFDGIEDFAVHPHDNAFNVVAGITLEAWIKPSRGTVRSSRRRYRRPFSCIACA